MRHDSIMIGGGGNPSYFYCLIWRESKLLCKICKGIHGSIEKETVKMGCHNKRGFVGVGVDGEGGYCRGGGGKDRCRPFGLNQHERSIAGDSLWMTLIRNLSTCPDHTSNLKNPNKTIQSLLYIIDRPPAE